MDFFVYRRGKLNKMVVGLQATAFLTVIATSLIFAPRYFYRDLFPLFVIAFILYTFTFGVLLFKKGKTANKTWYDLGEVAGEFLLVTLLILFTKGT